MKLPKDFVEEGLKMAEGASLFGVMFTDLDRDELLATAAQGWEHAKLHLLATEAAVAVARNTQLAAAQSGIDLLDVSAGYLMGSILERTPVDAPPPAPDFSGDGGTFGGGGASSGWLDNSSLSSSPSSDSSSSSSSSDSYSSSSSSDSISSSSSSSDY